MGLAKMQVDVAGAAQQGLLSEDGCPRGQMAAIAPFTTLTTSTRLKVDYYRGRRLITTPHNQVPLNKLERACRGALGLLVEIDRHSGGTLPGRLVASKHSLAGNIRFHVWRGCQLTNSGFRTG